MNEQGNSHPAGFRQNEVSAVVWPWTTAGARKSGPAKASVARIAVQALVPVVVGLVFYFLSHRVVAGVLWGIAAVLLGLGLFLPKAFHAFERFMRGFGQAVGTALTWILLVPFFYLVFMPGHLLMRVLSKDPLQLRGAKEAATCWSVRPPLKTDHFRKQF